MLSIPDMALLGAAALMFFGPEQLPKVARKVGLLVRDVQNTSQSFIREMERAADEPAGQSFSRANLIEDAVNPNGSSHLSEPYVHPYGENAPDDHPHWTPAEEMATHESAMPDAPVSPFHDAVSPHTAGATPADHELPP